LTGQAEALSDALGPIGALSVTALAQDVATLGTGLGSASEAARPLIVAMGDVGTAARGARTEVVAATEEVERSLSAQTEAVRAAMNEQEALVSASVQRQQDLLILLVTAAPSVSLMGLALPLARLARPLVTECTTERLTEPALALPPGPLERLAMPGPPVVAATSRAASGLVDLLGLPRAQARPPGWHGTPVRLVLGPEPAPQGRLLVPANERAGGGADGRGVP
jgi:hypothetical protein